MIARQVTIQRMDTRNGRYYTVDGDPRVAGRRLPSVTTVLSVIAKPGLVPWAVNVGIEKMRANLAHRLPLLTMDELSRLDVLLDGLVDEARKAPNQLRDQAADFGTRAHMLIAERGRGSNPKVPDDLRQVIENFDLWKKGLGTPFYLDWTEQMVYSAEHKYAGSIDALGRLGDQPVVLDWKTSNHIYPESFLQVAAYGMAIEEMIGIPMRQAWVIRLGKTTPEFEAVQVQNPLLAEKGFLAALQLWNVLEDLKSLR